jgi:23S rRNA pseudouridine1911/1915/1917 synthase
MSGREITRCKQFDDGVMVQRLGTEEKKKIMIRDTIAPGDKLIVRIYEDNSKAQLILPWDIPIDVVYEDDDLILINKPGDMVVHPSYAHFGDSLSNALAGYYQRTGQVHIIRAIGRLDRETSGLVMFAKNRHSAALLSDQKGQMSKRKEYLAIATGVFNEKRGTIDAPIERKDDSRMIRQVRHDGKEAITHYVVEKQFDKYALIRLHLDTGRTHQIRVHMAYIGLPLVGDTLYGNNDESSYGLTRAALHAARMEFTQPINGENLAFDVPMPADMMALC